MIALLIRYRRWIGAVLAGLIGLSDRHLPYDFLPFAGLADRMLAGRFDLVYGDTYNQAGPLQLLITRAFEAGGSEGQPAAVTRIGVDVALLLGAMAVCRSRGAVREVVAGVLTLLWMVGPVPFSGHPAEVVLAMLWAYAVHLLRRGRWRAAAGALGLSVLITPVGVVGFACVLGCRRVVRTWAGAGLLAITGYLPFVLSGNFRMLGTRWAVQPGTLPRLLGLTEVGWPLRPVQAIIVAAGCGLVAYLCRGTVAAIGVAPLTAGLLRVATDPQAYDYYWMPAAVGSVLLLAFGTGWRWSLGIGYLAMLSAAARFGASGALGCLVLVLIQVWRARTARRAGSASAKAMRLPPLLKSSP